MNFTLNLDGKEYRCTLGLAFLGEALEETGLTVEQLGRKIVENPFRYIPTVIYLSVKTRTWLDQSQGLNVPDFDHTLLEFVNAIEAEGGLQSPNVVKFLERFKDSLEKNIPRAPEVVKKKE